MVLKDSPSLWSYPRASTVTISLIAFMTSICHDRGGFQLINLDLWPKKLETNKLGKFDPFPLATRKNSTFIVLSGQLSKYPKFRSGQVWEHAPEQRAATSTFRRYSRGLRLAIPKADAWPITISLRCLSTCCNNEAHGWPVASSTHEAPSLRESDERDWHQENEPHGQTVAADAHGLYR